jgi:hypothetical protein
VFANVNFFSKESLTQVFGMKSEYVVGLISRCSHYLNVVFVFGNPGCLSRTVGLVITRTKK